MLRAITSASLSALEREAIEAEDKLKRLYRMVEDGVAELDDILRDRIALRSDRKRAHAALDRIRLQPGRDAVSSAMLEKFCSGMRENIATGGSASVAPISALSLIASKSMTMLSTSSATKLL